MKLTKPMLKAFNYIAEGENTLTKVAQAIHKSIYWTDTIVNSLEKEGFVIKKGNYTLKGSRMSIEVASTAHALKLRDLIFEYHGISFEDVLTESRLLFLAAICEDWMSIETAAQLSKISKHIIYRYRRRLRNRGVIEKKGNLYKINNKAWPLLKDFLISYRNYASIEGGRVVWKYGEEILFEVNNETQIQDNATGLYAYKDYGVSVGVISAFCISPKRKLSKEEIFVHSLFEVDDPRTLHLALTFYIKNKLKYKNILPLAMKYGKYTMFENFVSLLKTKEEKVKIEGLPTFERRDFIRIANMYGVENV